MRQGPHNKRGRGRGGNNTNINRRSGTPNRNQTFDSNGPEVRIRGNANQVHEKYLTLARDAAQNGDRVLAESYFQHAEHYYRIISTFTDEAAADPNRHRGNGQHQNYNDDGAAGTASPQYQEDVPQPDLDQTSAAPRANQPRASGEEPSTRSQAVVESKSPVPTPRDESSAPDAAAVTTPSPVETPTEKPRDEAPAPRPLSLRRRRASVVDPAEARNDESPKRDAKPNAGPPPGVTVTVVGAPVLDPTEAPPPPPRPRRRAKAAAPPLLPEETSGD